MAGYPNSKDEGRLALLRATLTIGDLMSGEEFIELMDGRIDNIYRLGSKKPYGIEPPKPLIRASNKRPLFIRKEVLAYMRKVEAYEAVSGRTIGVKHAKD